MTAVARETLAFFFPQQIPQASRQGPARLATVPQRQIRHNEQVQ